jgi:small subunit ribosomal protein S6
VTQVAEAVENDVAQDAEETTGAVATSDEAANIESVNEETAGETNAAAEEEAAVPEQPTRDADGFSSALPSLSSEAEPRKPVPGGVGYEVIYVVRAGDPQIVESSSQKVRELIEGGQGAVDNVRASEVRRFAYPIQKQTEGVYIVVNARFKPEFTAELERYFKIDENILRHMVLKEEH